MAEVTPPSESFLERLRKLREAPEDPSDTPATFSEIRARADRERQKRERES